MLPFPREQLFHKALRGKGQQVVNALAHADATGIILTKLDGTAKGGCVVAVKQRLGLPVRFIGVGEGIDDLLPFTPEGFVEELLPREWKH